jgi:hypothetical protein
MVKPIGEGILGARNRIEPDLTSTHRAGAAKRCDSARGMQRTSDLIEHRDEFLVLEPRNGKLAPG